MTGRSRKRLLLAGISLAGILTAVLLLLRTSVTSAGSQSPDYWVDQLWTGRNEEVERAIRQLGPGAAPAILQRVRGFKPRMHPAYQFLWAKLPPGLQRRFPVPQSAAHLHKSAYALSLLGTEVVPQLTKACASRNANVRWVAVAALENLGSEAVAAVPALITLLRDADPQIGCAAARGLARMAPESRAAIPALLRLLREANARASTRTNDPIRAAAARALGEFGPEAREAVPLLQDLLSESDPNMRVPAAASLWKVGGENSVIPVLVTELEGTQDAFLCLRILRDLATIGPPARTATNAILDKWRQGKLRSGSLWLDVRPVAREALVSIAPEMVPETPGAAAAPPEVLKLGAGTREGKARSGAGANDPGAGAEPGARPSRLFKDSPGLMEKDSPP